MRYHPIDQQLFIQNRKNFVSKLLPNSMAVFHSNDEMYRSGDQNYIFHQNADLFYLSGIDQEQTVLVLFPSSPLENYREILFLRETNDTIAVWEGQKYTRPEATEISGIRTVMWLDRYEAVMRELMVAAEHIYLNTNEYPRYSTDLNYRDIRLGKRLMEQFPFHSYHRSAPIMRTLRTVKHPLETGLIRHAIGITEKAFRRVLKFVRPGVKEYEAEAEIIHEFIRSGCSGHAFPPIIASGASACVLHYEENHGSCGEGELLLMDFGAEYAHYCSDMTRTIPVGGRFTTRQREVYEAVLRVMKQAVRLFVPGNTIDRLHREVCGIMEQELLGLGLLNAAEIRQQDPEKPCYLKYFPHGTTHFLGLDVHDVGTKQQAFEAGMILTCEPGIYIREEGIGIRLENDILITEAGPVDLMEGIPLEPEDIESLMNK
ncbi:MAG TPA: aminopeptidase P N-terminal domain-containing protein [Bacteroidales bacterium]|nr:aminopeptidase P N-terminal domain-containing protein [Bacteroidales bacterium]HSA42152.1 aminopeptidase P N-terminal domain-containing protein [Bacteroidales bacterium]